ncbi:hypothetical protein [Streptacidiphilus sp. EB129]|uniref:hypothetical protein n=1 Tax=Streptacidiphilus sp. EB129 TaxID=3156262 RepID=UPI0035112938
MKLMRNALVAAVAAMAVAGVVAPVTAQAAVPRTVAAVQADDGHRHECCRDRDRGRDDWNRDDRGRDDRCRDRDRDRDHDRCDRDHHGVEAGGGGMAASVAGRTRYIGG